MDGWEVVTSKPGHITSITIYIGTESRLIRQVVEATFSESLCHWP